MGASQPVDDLTAGRDALNAGDWPEAQRAFERLLAIEETPEALEGLGLAAWWLNLGEVVFDSRERAFRAYRQRGDQNAAARMAVWLAWDSAAFRGEEGVAKGWLQRARRLLEGRPDSPEHAFLVNGRFALRACIVNFRTSLTDIEVLLATLARHGQEAERTLQVASGIGSSPGDY